MGHQDLEEIRIGKLLLYPALHQAIEIESGNTIILRKKEAELLGFFAKNRNRVIDKATLLEHVWNYDIYSSTKTLEVHIANLRSVLKLKNYGTTLKTVHGAGYKLVETPDYDISLCDIFNSKQLSLF